MRVVLLLAFMLTANATAAQDRAGTIQTAMPIVCQDAMALRDALRAEKFMPISEGITVNSRVLFVTWAHPDGRWIATVVRAENGIACIVGVGQDFRLLIPDMPEPEGHS